MRAKNNLSRSLKQKNLLKTSIIVGIAGAIILAGILLVTQSHVSIGPSGYTGPAGIGDQTENNLWIDYSQLGAPNNSKITTAPDLSGNNNTATATGNQKPTVKDNVADRVHGRAVADFDGTDDALTIANSNSINNTGPQEGRTLVVSFCTDTDITTQQFLYEEGGTVRGLNMYLQGGKIYFGAYNKSNDDGNVSTPWGYVSVNAPITAQTCYVAMLTFDYPNDQLVGYLNGAVAGTVGGIGRLFAHGDPTGLGAINSDSHDVSGAMDNPTARRNFRGRMMEFVSYGELINTAQRQILTNYFAAKYAISIVNDVFAHEATHSHEVAGIWMAADGSSHEDAQGPAPLRIKAPADLDPNEGLIWGHNDVGMEVINSVDVDAGQSVRSRLGRTWQFSAGGSPGAVTLMMDATLVTTDPGDLRLLIERSGDNFQTADVVPIPGTYDAGTGMITFSNVALLDGDLVTLGTSSQFLPVELVSFDVAPTGNKVSLTWSTASELNNDRFEIERSADGLDFASIAQQAGAGNSQQMKSYAFEDVSPLPGTSYYRLRQVDVDGTHAYSRIRSVKVEGVTQVTMAIFPNPGVQGENLHLQIASHSEGDAQVRILSIDGRMLQQESHTIRQGQQTLTVPTDRLSAGIYLVQVLFNDEQIVQKVTLR